MIFSKKINRITLSFAFVFLIVCGYMIAKINISYPSAKLVSNSENNSVMWYGCEITALKKTIYTIPEFIEKYPEEQRYKNMMDFGMDYTDCGFVVYKINVKNMTDKKIEFVLPLMAIAQADPSGWFNGIQSGGAVLEPGESKEIEGNAYFGTTLMYPSLISGFQNNQFCLAFSYYPEKIILKFQ